MQKNQVIGYYLYFFSKMSIFSGKFAQGTTYGFFFGLRQFEIEIVNKKQFFANCQTIPPTRVRQRCTFEYTFYPFPQAASKTFCLEKILEIFFSAKEIESCWSKKSEVLKQEGSPNKIKVSIACESAPWSTIFVSHNRILCSNESVFTQFEYNQVVVLKSLSKSFLFCNFLVYLLFFQDKIL